MYVTYHIRIREDQTRKQDLNRRHKSIQKLRDLCLNERPIHSCDHASPSGIAEISKKTDQFSVIGRQSRNIIPLVVGIGTRESLASRNGSVAVLGEEHLDALIVGGVDNGRDIEVSSSGVAVPAKLSEHTGDVVSSIGDRVEVSNPRVREGLVGGCETSNVECGDGFETLVGSEVDGASSSVLVDEVDHVCCSGHGGKGKEGSEELHFECVCGGFVLGF